MKKIVPIPTRRLRIEDRNGAYFSTYVLKKAKDYNDKITLEISPAKNRGKRGVFWLNKLDAHLIMKVLLNALMYIDDEV